MKKLLFFLLFTLISSIIFAEPFEGVFDIKFGQTAIDVKNNLEQKDFRENNLSLYSSNTGNSEIAFTKKQTSFSEVECDFLTILAVFDQNDKINEILVFCENYSLDNDELYIQIEKSINILSKKYDFKISSEEDYNTREMFIIEMIDKNSTFLKICKNNNLVLYDFKRN